MEHLVPPSLDEAYGMRLAVSGDEGSPLPHPPANVSAPIPATTARVRTLVRTVLVRWNAHAWIAGAY